MKEAMVISAQICSNYGNFLIILYEIFIQFLVVVVDFRGQHFFYALKYNSGISNCNAN